MKTQVQNCDPWRIREEKLSVLLLFCFPSRIGHIILNKDIKIKTALLLTSIIVLNVIFWLLLAQFSRWSWFDVSYFLLWILLVNIHVWSFFPFLFRIILVSNKLLILSSSIEKSTWIFFLLAGTNQICLKTSQLAPVKLVPVTPSNLLKQRAAK